jgi:hypothetical protein
MTRAAALLLFGITMLLFAAPGLAQNTNDPKFGDTRFMFYEGDQRWPTADSAEAISGFAVPIYVGLPTRPYKVLGRIYDPRATGIGIVGRVFAEGLFSESDRQRDCANQARFRGGNAVVVTNDERIVSVLNLTRSEIEGAAPLFDHKDSVVLAVKIE